MAAASRRPNNLLEPAVPSTAGSPFRECVDDRHPSGSALACVKPTMATSSITTRRCRSISSRSSPRISWSTAASRARSCARFASVIRSRCTACRCRSDRPMGSTATISPTARARRRDRAAVRLRPSQLVADRGLQLARPAAAALHREALDLVCANIAHRAGRAGPRPCWSRTRRPISPSPARR